MPATTTKKTPPLIVTPLGGLGEVGMNLMVYECQDTMIVVDCGVLFPNADMPGVDMVFPDLTHLLENKKKVKAVFLTHGHEDHIGALPFLLDKINVPVYGTPMTLALVKAKLAEHGLDKKTKLIPVPAGETAKKGPFSVEYIRVTHSIIDAASLAITTPAGVIIHTGDFKIDPTPVDGELFDEDRFREYGDAGVLALLSDSTNSERPGSTRSESDVGRSLHRLFGEIPGRVILATFSSNIHRVQQVIDAAHANNKKVAIVGRSMTQNTRIAHEMGYLKYPKNTVVPIEDIKDHPDTPAVIITTGSQGEPMSALSRMSIGEHRNITIHPGDTVMLSSRTIPGNELSIGRVVNHLYKMGTRVIHDQLSEIHVSGHAAQEEQVRMLELVRPRYFVPVHGEWRHLHTHARTAQAHGVPPERTFIIENGERLKVSHQQVVKLDPVAAGRTFVDGHAVHDSGTVILRDRQSLSAAGILIVVIGIEMHTGARLLGPEILTRGFVVEEESPGLIDELKDVVEGALDSLDKDALGDVEVVRARVRNRTRKYISRTLGRRPIVMPMILEM